MRKLIAGVCVVAAALTAGCLSREPNSLFESRGYHVRGDTVYFLNAFPGSAFVVDGADAATFEILDGSYARDAGTVYLDGAALPGVDAATFELLERPDYSRDRDRIYLRGEPLSDDPEHFEFVDGDLAKDGTAVYWSDGSVLSSDPEHFEVVSNEGYYLFTKDSTAVHVNGTLIDGAEPALFEVLGGAYSVDGQRVYYFTDEIPGADLATFAPVDGPYAADVRRVYWMGTPIDGAEPASFRVLNADFECSTDALHAYYRQIVIAGAEPSTFPNDRAVTTCSESSITFAE